MIGGCLDSIRDAVDEMIVLDTGSTDDTVKIAKAKGATIYHHQWQDDFSEARNVCVRQATTDKVFIIDADERLHPDDHAAFRKAVKEDMDATAFGIINKTPSGISTGAWYRLFKTGAVRYEGIVHNQPIFEGKESVSPVRLIHLGYDLAPDKLADKYKRTERLLRKQIAEKGKKSFYIANLVRNLLVQKKYVLAIAEANEFDALVQAQEATYTADSYQRIMVDKINALTQIGDYQTAIETGAEFLKEYSENLDAIYLLALAYGVDRQDKKAIEYYSRYLALLQQIQKSGLPIGVMIDSWGAKNQAFCGIGAHLLHTNEYKKAAQAFGRSLNNKYSSEAHIGFCTALRHVGQDLPPLNILFVQTSPCIRNWKLARGLRDMGHRVTLAYSAKSLDEAYPGIEDVYEQQIHIVKPAQLFDLCRQADIVHVHNEPDIMTPVIKEAVPEAVVVHDTHDTLELRNPSSAVAYVEKKAADLADGHLYVTGSQFRFAQSAYGVKGSDSIYIANYPSRKWSDPKQLPKLSETDGRFHAVYAGGLNTITGIAQHRNMLGIFQELADDGIVVHIYPSSDAKAYQELADKHENIIYHGVMCPEDLVSELTQYDAGLLTWLLTKETRPHLDTCIANKLFEYIEAGLPVISADTVEMASFILRHKIGIVYQNIGEIKDRIEEVKAIDVAGVHFYMENEIPTLAGFYSYLIEKGSGTDITRTVYGGIAALCKDEATNQVVKKNERPVEYAFVFDTLWQYSPDTILDVGPGKTALPHLMRTCGFDVMAIDNWFDYWKHGEFNRHWAVLPVDIRYPQALGDRKFDFITCVSTLEHIVNPELAFENMLSLLNDGGHLVLTVPYNRLEGVENIYADPRSGYEGDAIYPCRIFCEDELRGWCNKYGGEIVDAEMWNCFSGGLWQVGERLEQPKPASVQEMHDLACFLVSYSPLKRGASCFVEGLS